MSISKKIFLVTLMVGGYSVQADPDAKPRNLNKMERILTAYSILITPALVSVGYQAIFDGPPRTSLKSIALGSATLLFAAIVIEHVITQLERWDDNLRRLEEEQCEARRAKEHQQNLEESTEDNQE